MINKITYNLTQYLYLNTKSDLITKIKETDIDIIILKIMLLFPITTIIQGIDFFSPINKILTGILLLILFFTSFKNINVKYFLLKQ